MIQLPFHILSAFCVHHCDALKTRMKITTNPYNAHIRLLSFRVLVFANSSLLGTEWEPLLLCNQARANARVEGPRGCASLQRHFKVLLRWVLNSIGTLDPCKPPIKNYVTLTSSYVP